MFDFRNITRVMKHFLLLVVVVTVLTTSFALPVTKNEPQKEEKPDENHGSDLEVVSS